MVTFFDRPTYMLVLFVLDLFPFAFRFPRPLVETTQVFVIKCLLQVEKFIITLSQTMVLREGCSRYSVDQSVSSLIHTHPPCMLIFLGSYSNFY